MKRGDSDFERQLQMELSNAAGIDLGSSWQGAPKIVYASRTHSQLAQVINELKNTRYKPRICVLGSRDQLCINSEVNSLESNAAKVQLCKVKTSSRTCPFFNNLEANKSNPSFSGNILDIEDLVDLGNKNRVCPYYMSRELRTNADLIFMPYNYVLDFKSRQAHSIDLTNTVILLDEAHNVEQVCESTASFDLTSYDIACCFEDLDECIRILKEAEAMSEEVTTESKEDLSIEDVVLLKGIFKALEDEIASVDLNAKEGIDKNASYIFDLFRGKNLTADTMTQVLEVIEKCNGVLAGHGSSVHKGKHFALQKFADVIKILFNQDSSEGRPKVDTSGYYRVYIHKDKMTEKQKKSLDVWSTKTKKTEGRTLSYWCFNPGLTMKELINQGVRCIVLTSGTLSPLNSFKSELQIPFPVQLENPHVIERHQIWTGIITKGPDGQELNSSYEKRYTVEYQRSLGNVIVNLARITPHGLLVFFPSYPVMEKCLGMWQSSGIFGRISQNKACSIEPRNKIEFVREIEEFYNKVKDPDLKGAIFFAVCRGKVSEGLDFADMNGRAVVITGLPFPPKADPRVILKMDHLDRAKKGEARSYGLTGREWYRLQASRAVNQAIGRVIRHKKDYGAILLCDVRFTYTDAKAQLPSWIRPHVKTYPDFGSAQREVVQFFRKANQLMGPPQVKKVANKDDRLTSQPQIITPSFSKPQAAGLSEFSRPDSTATGTPLNTEATHSLMVLETESSSSRHKSLLESLSSTESRKDTECSTNSSETLSSVILKKMPLSDGPSSSNQKTKRLKIVTRARTEESGKQQLGHDQERPSSPTVEEGKSRNQRLTEAKQYIADVKRKLDKESYLKFGSVLATYKKSYDLHLLVKELTCLFHDKPVHSYLFEGFGSFIKKESDRKLFAEAYKKFKSTLSARSDKHSSVTVEPLAKRARVENFSGASDNSKATNRHADFFPTLSDDDSDDDDGLDIQAQMAMQTCTVCKKKPVKPFQAPCKHVACMQCWVNHLKGERNCPICTIEIRKKQLHKIFFP